MRADPRGAEPTAASAGNGARRGSREQVLHLLAEAAELEHNILCSYLYAVFSLKQSEAEGVTSAELEAIVRWRGEVMGLCVEEMIHLAQVSNLMVALGSRPHFNRPNLPVPPGYHPAGVTIALAPFALDTLEHFIFLERPQEIPVPDPASFQDDEGAERPAPAFQPLMPRAPSYGTIGEFYEALRQALAEACADFGERRLFSGPTGLQLTAREIGSPELVVVRSFDDAKRAIDFIVDQGEGSGAQREDSHFGRFESIRNEYLAMLEARPDFDPARPVARDPVMHEPMAKDRVWIEGRQAAPVIDTANAAYAAMLRCLTQLYDTPALHAERRQALLGGALAGMKAMTALGSFLTELPASDAAALPRAGMSFAMLRATEGPVADKALPMLAERLMEIAARVPALGLREQVGGPLAAGLMEAAQALQQAK